MKTYKKQLSDSEIKQNLVLILEHFDDFCRKNNLCYSLAGGTLIGALRHKGFIPWDDDIDVFMTRNQYERFLKLYNSNKYHLVTAGKKSNWSDSYSRLTDMHTIVYRKDYTPKHGLWLAILPIDGYPGDMIWNKNLPKLEFWSAIGRLKQSSWVSFSSPVRNILKKLGKLLLLPVPQYFVANKIKSIVSKYPIGSTAELGSHSTYMIKKDKIPHHFDNDCMTNYIDVSFEGLKVMAMEGYDKYLSGSFGNWHELPPVNQRVTHGYSAYYID